MFTGKWAQSTKQQFCSFVSLSAWGVAGQYVIYLMVIAHQASGNLTEVLEFCLSGSDNHVTEAPYWINK